MAEGTTGKQEENTKGIRRKYEGNTKRIRREYEDTSQATRLRLACICLEGGFTREHREWQDPSQASTSSTFSTAARRHRRREGSTGRFTDARLHKAHRTAARSARR